MSQSSPPDEGAFVRHLLDCYEGAAWLLDTKCCYLVGNVAFESRMAQALGRPVRVGEDVLAMDWPEEVAQNWRNAYMRALRGEEFTVEWSSRVLPTTREVDYQFRPWRDGNGNVCGVAVFSRDITEQRRAERQLRLQLEIGENLSEGISLVRADAACIVFANASFEKMFGYERGELLGKHVSILNSSLEDNPQRVAEQILSQLEQTGRWSGQIWNVRKDGTSFLSQAFVTQAHHPQYGKVWLSTHVDITSQRRTEVALKETQLQLRAILEHAPLLICAKTLSGTVLFVNRRFELLDPQAPATWVGKRVFELFPPEVSARMSNQDQEVARTGTPQHNEEQLRHSDGTWHTYQKVKFPLVNEDGHAFGVASIALDITERLEGDKQRRELQEKMTETQRLESLGVLAGGIAHDLNNLLVPVLNNSYLLRTSAWDAESVSDLADQIETGARHCRDLVQQILAFAGKGRLVTQPVRIDRMLDELQTFLRASVAKSVRMERRQDENLPSVDGEPGQIRQILVNLIINASEALAGRPGTIWVRLIRLTPQDALRLSAGFSDGVVLEIEDNGPGIPKEILDRIFDPFFSTKSTGRGLGLSAVRGIVRSHGGVLDVQSTVGRGTLFRIAFPAGTLVQAAHIQPVSRRRTGKKMVLIVDDEPAVRETTRLLLEHYGFLAKEVGSGEDALAFLLNSQQHVDAVLLDLTMPGMSGGETLERLSRSAPDLPVIIMSGYSASDALSPALLSQVAGILSKPFLPDKLLALLDGVCQSGRASTPRTGDDRQQ